MKARTLRALLEQQHGPSDTWRVRCLAIDPGGTVGHATFEGGSLVSCGQIAGEFVPLERLILATAPALVVMEAYVLYPWKKQNWSDFPVSQLIGAARLTCERAGIPVVMKPAAFTKSWMSDRKLRELGLYQVGARHCNDAIRLGASFLMFGKL